MHQNAPECTRMNQGCTTYLHNVPTEQGTVGSSGRSFHAKHGTGPSPLPPTVHATDAFEILGAVVGAQIDDQRQHLLRIRQVVVVVAVLQRTGASAAGKPGNGERGAERGDGEWTQEKGHREWTQKVDTESGHRKWTQRVDTESGHREWTQRGDTESGHRK